MKKKIFILALISVMAFALCACGGSNSSSEPAKKDFEGNYQDMGIGVMYISTPGGTSQDGNVPVLYASKDDMLIQIGVNSEGMDGSKLSFIYVDGMKASEEQLADAQCSLDLQGNMLSEGKHLVEVVQYENDDIAGNVITYKSAQYEVKMK